MARVLSIPTAVMDYRLVQAMNEIRENYGDTVDVISKAKSLLKFGKNEDVGGTTETVWSYGGVETYVTGNDIDTVSSSNASDTATVLTVEGHTVSGTGTDAQFTFVIQDVTLNGQNKVLLGTPLARVSRAYVKSGTLLGDFYVYEDDTLTAGVPQTAANVHLTIEGASGETQSFKAATTFSNTDYFICTGGFASVRRSQTAAVDFEMQVRQVGGVFRPVARIATNSTGSSTVQITFDPFVIVPKNADIRVQASSSAASTTVDASFQGYLAQVIG